MTTPIKMIMNWFGIVAVGLVTGGMIAVIAPTVATAQSAVDGTSVQLRLEDLVPSNADAENLARLSQALDELGTVSSESFQRVRDARLAYEQDPNAETESGLFHANANVLRSQYEALGGVIQAVEDAGKVLDKLRSDTTKAKGTFAEQAGTAEQARRRAHEVVERIEGQLQKLAARYDEVVGPDGQIEDEAVEDAVLQLDANRDYAEIVAQLATGDSQAAQADQKLLGEIADRLRRQRSRLRVIALRAQSQRAALAIVARSQIERMDRHDLLLKGTEFLRWVDGLNADGRLEGKPVFAMPTPGGSVLTDYGMEEVSGRSGADILREQREKAADGRRANSAQEAL